MKAIFNKQTEKAINISYVCEIYGEFFKVKNVWFPKSQLDIKLITDSVVEFEPKNNWILDVKTKEYCRYMAETFGNVKSEIQTYLSNINCEKVTRVSC